MLLQLVSLLGAALILGAYAANLRGWLAASDRRYHLLNLVGAACLVWVAVVDRRAGFIVLEGAWAVASFVALVGSARKGAVGS